jgi:hypothetical protein
MFVFYCVRYCPTGYVGTIKNFRKNVYRGDFQMTTAGKNGANGGGDGGLAAMEGNTNTDILLVLD